MNVNSQFDNISKLRIEQLCSQSVSEFLLNESEVIELETNIKRKEKDENSIDVNTNEINLSENSLPDKLQGISKVEQTFSNEEINKVERVIYKKLMAGEHIEENSIKSEKDENANEGKDSAKNKHKIRRRVIRSQVRTFKDLPPLDFEDIENDNDENTSSGLRDNEPPIRVR